MVQLFECYRQMIFERFLRLFLAVAFVVIGNFPSQAKMLDDILHTKVLKVCIWPDYYGISYHNPLNGKFQGIDIVLSNALANELNVQLDYVETDFSHVVEDLETNKCQIAMMGVGVTPQRAAHIDFSSPYLRSDVYAIASRSNESIRTWEDIDARGRVVVVQKGTFMEPLMQKTLRHAALSVVDQAGERELEVKSGRADVFITDYPYSQRMLKSADWIKVIGPSHPIQPTDYAYAIPKGNAEWLARINQFVSHIKKDGVLAEAAAPYNLLPIIVTE